MTHFNAWFTLLLLAGGPLWMLCFGGLKLRADWQRACRRSVGSAPLPQAHPEALILLYGARTFNWRGIFALHTWLAVKAEQADAYTIYQVIGWRAAHGMSIVSVSHEAPDRRWFGNAPVLLGAVQGAAATALIPQITAAVRTYRYPKHYGIWPGPNSNTFIAMVLRQVPGLRLRLPGTALGKDFLGYGRWIAKTPSGTGIQISLVGLLGISVAWIEGLEINVLGLVWGLDWRRLTLQLPGIGLLRLPVRKVS